MGVTGGKSKAAAADDDEEDGVEDEEAEVRHGRRARALRGRVGRRCVEAGTAPLAQLCWRAVTKVARAG